jgi:hypothetical protein
MYRIHVHVRLPDDYFPRPFSVLRSARFSVHFSLDDRVVSVGLQLWRSAMSTEDDLAISDSIVNDYDTYEDYLDSQITPTDIYYLEDEDLARQLVELGYRGSGETLKRDEFLARKKAAEQARLNKLRATPKPLASAFKDVTGFPFLASLAEREEMVRNGKLTTIIFIRDKNAKGQEVSGYIDYAHRLKTENFEPYFERKKKLMPTMTDLSFYNWETQTSTSNATPNFQVIADNEAGLLFKNKRDRKVINVDPKARPGDNSRRIELHTHEYTQVVLYDHVTRRKT